jgi:hypothetical protein
MWAMSYSGLESTTPTGSSWRRETDEDEFYALCIAFALPHGKKILSVCNLPSKRCGIQTMLEKGTVKSEKSAFLMPVIAKKRSDTGYSLR